MADDPAQTPTEPKAAATRGTPAGQGTVTPEHGGRIGNPPHVPTEAGRERVRQLAKVFPEVAQKYIAALMGISDDTLRKYYQDDLLVGRAEMLASVGAQLINAAIDTAAPTAKGDRDLQKFVMARLGGWSTQVEVGGKEGKPIEFRHLSESEVDARLRELNERYGTDAPVIAS